MRHTTTGSAVLGTAGNWLGDTLMGNGIGAIALDAASPLTLTGNDIGTIANSASSLTLGNSYMGLGSLSQATALGSETPSISAGATIIINAGVVSVSATVTFPNEEPFEFYMELTGSTSFHLPQDVYISDLRVTHETEDITEISIKWGAGYCDDGDRDSDYRDDYDPTNYGMVLATGASDFLVESY